LDVRTEPKR